MEETDNNEGGRHAAYRTLRAFPYWYEEEVEPEGWRYPIQKVKAPKVPANPIDPVSLDVVLIDTEHTSSEKYKGNSYVAWREVTPMHRDLVEAMLQSKAHIIGTMRSKTEYVQEKDDRGKTVIRKVGIAPIQREGMDYEFDIVFDMDWDHNAIVSKSRCFALADQVFYKPGDDVAQIILDWLTEGKPADAEDEIVAEKRGPNKRSQPALLMWARQNYDMSGAQVGEALKAAGFSKFDPGR